LWSSFFSQAFSTCQVDLCFDQLVFKLSEIIFTYYKTQASSKMLEISFLEVVENQEKYQVFPKRFDSLFRMRRVKLLGRTIDLAFLFGQRMNKIFRENLDFLFERFEAHDLCSIVVCQSLFSSRLDLTSVTSGMHTSETETCT
jgi:cytoplasmic FMR1 interacting protein